ncbi:hypothetical protein BDC45DRAFT_542756 [Circinella umbellata]|nr:hypothetical protein BDC45DRAFT_542756 [Circinella umbellata]
MINRRCLRKIKDFLKVFWTLCSKPITTSVKNHEWTHTYGRFIPLYLTIETLKKVEKCVLELPVEKPYSLIVAVLESAYIELLDLTNEFPCYLQSADITPRKMCITFCAPDIAMKVDFKKHPMLTDVTYDCFMKGYYLCTTNIYFEEIDKFGVIFQGVLDGLSTIHFKNYFLSFFKTFDLVFGYADEFYFIKQPFIY